MKSNRKSYEKENQILWESSVDGMERKWKYIESGILLSGKTQITYKSLRNCLYIGNSAFFFEIQAP